MAACILKSCAVQDTQSKDWFPAIHVGVEGADDVTHIFFDQKRASSAEAQKLAHRLLVNMQSALLFGSFVAPGIVHELALLGGAAPVHPSATTKKGLH